MTILIACRESKLQIISSDERVMFNSKEYLFVKNNFNWWRSWGYCWSYGYDTNTEDIFRQNYKDIVDYVFRIEYELDRNGRKESLR